MAAANTAKSSTILLIDSPDWQDYGLVDSGDGRKLECFGGFRLLRPEPEAIWKPALPGIDWERVDAFFTPGTETHGGHWEKRSDLPDHWQMQYKGLRFWIQLSASRHVGVFPEQAAHWDWIADRIRSAESMGRKVRVLNLFGYTGLASIAAAGAGAQVVHVDASRKAIEWAKENQSLSGLDVSSIRWIEDDAVKFVRRENRRGSFYDGIILDPPKFGRGPQGEVWEFYKLIPELLQNCARILGKDPLFIVMTAYAVKASSLTLQNALVEIMKPWHGETNGGELVIREKSAQRLVSMAIFARWCAKD